MGKAWYCDGCFPEDVAQAEIDTDAAQRCSVCKMTFERKHMKYVDDKMLPPRLQDKKRG